MDYDSCRSLPAMFFEQAERLGNKPFLWAKRGGSYRLGSKAYPLPRHPVEGISGNQARIGGIG